MACFFTRISSNVNNGNSPAQAIVKKDQGNSVYTIVQNTQPLFRFSPHKIVLTSIPSSLMLSRENEVRQKYIKK